MKKPLIILFIVIALLTAQFSGTVGAACFAAANETNAEQNFSVSEGSIRQKYASVQESAAAQPTQAQLFLPESYEQYLELEKPTDFDVNSRYIAIADQPASGNSRIYVFDKTQQTPKYAVYEHENTNSLSSLHLYENGGKTHLYFVEGSTLNVQHFDCAPQSGTFEPIKTDLSASSFIVCNGYIFYSTVTTDATSVMRRSLNGFDVGETTDNISFGAASAGGITPYFMQGKASPDKIYFSINSVIYSVTGSSVNATAEKWDIKSSVKSFAVIGSNKVVYSTTASNYPLFAYTNGTSEEIKRNGSGVTGVPSMRLVGDALYFICGKNVQAIEAGSNRFKNYEIGKYSVSDVRLGGDAKISAYNGKLVISDAVNRRVSIFDEQSGNFSYVKELPFPPSAVCAGKEDFLVADDESNSVRIYSYDDLSSSVTLPISGDLIDAAWSSDAYYLLIAGPQKRGVVEKKDGNFAVTFSNSQITSAEDSIAADLFGNIYMMTSNAVYLSNEKNFLSDAGSESLCTFEGSTLDLAVDYTGTPFALTADSVLRMDTNKVQTQFGFSQSLTEAVFTKNTPTALSFALDHIGGSVYILCDGFIFKTQNINANTLHSLNAEGVYEDLYSAAPNEAAAAERLITARKDSVTVLLDEKSLRDNPSVLPCGDFGKSTETKTGVVLSRKDYGTIALFYRYDETTKPVTRDYEIRLILKTDDASFTPSKNYLTNTDNGAARTGNAVGLYRFPVMRTGKTATGESTGNTYTPFGRMRELESGTAVTVLGKLSDEKIAAEGKILDSDYYFVSVTENGRTDYGFIPCGYVLLGIGNDTQTGIFAYRNLARGKSVTLSLDSEIAESAGLPSELTLKNGETLKVYTEKKNESGKIYAEYEREGYTYCGWIDESALYEATPSVITVLVVVCVVAAVVIVSVCYLILRKQPTLQ